MEGTDERFRQICRRVGCSTDRRTCGNAAIQTRAERPFWGRILSRMLQIMASFIDSNPMEKDRELRYQHTSEMKTDLMRVKRDSRFGRVEQAECRRGDRRF